MGSKALKDHFGADFETTPVKTGDSISIGKNNLTFVETRLLHWPDSMITLSRWRKNAVLSGRLRHAFGRQPYVLDEYPENVIEWEAQKYYANILMPYSSKVIGLLGKPARTQS